MKFSLVITTYNSEKFIIDAIESALNQTRLPDEIIICDDNSKDNTINNCNKYNDKIQIHINKDGPSGFTNAFNYALKLGSHDYITILHYDDVLHPYFFEFAEYYFNKFKDCKFLTCNNYYFKNNNEIKNDPIENTNSIAWYLNGKEYALKYFHGVINNNHINRCPGTVFHKSLINLINFRVEAGLMCDDDLFYRIGKFTDVILLGNNLAGVRINNESESGKLNNLKLNSEISKGYLFLIQDWNKENLLGDFGLINFIILFIKFNFRALYYSIKYDENEFKKLSFLDYKNIKNLYPVVIKKNIKLYHKIFYFFLENNLSLFVKLYIKFLDKKF